jgi:hypothetical protein
LLAVATLFHAALSPLHHSLATVSPLGFKRVELVRGQQAASAVLERLLLHAQLRPSTVEVLSCLRRD